MENIVVVVLYIHSSIMGWKAYRHWAKVKSKPKHSLVGFILIPKHFSCTLVLGFVLRVLILFKMLMLLGWQGQFWAQGLSTIPVHLYCIYSGLEVHHCSDGILTMRLLSPRYVVGSLQCGCYHQDKWWDYYNAIVINKISVGIIKMWLLSPR